MIVRDGNAIPPRGSTELREGDELHILVRSELRDEVEELTERWAEGPDRRARPAAAAAAAAPPRSSRCGPAREATTRSRRARSTAIPVVAVLRSRRDAPAPTGRPRRRPLRGDSARAWSRSAAAGRWPAGASGAPQRGGRRPGRAGLVAGGDRRPDRARRLIGRHSSARALRRRRRRRSRRRRRRGRRRRRRPSRRRRARRRRRRPSRRSSASMPPSTSIRASPTSGARRSTLSGEASMKDWPPQPGLTVMQRTMSARPRSSATASTGVPGLIAMPARQPSSRIAARVRLACGVASSWKVIESAPASANSSIWRSGASIIRWTSTTPPASWTWSAIEPSDQRPDRDRRDEVAVHHVEVDHPRAGVHHLVDLGAEPGEVGREDRRRDPRRSAISSRHPLAHGRSLLAPRRSARALSIECAAGLAFMSSVLLIRAIVWCSPQLGHCETSSKRLQTVHAAQAARQLGRAQPGLAAARAWGPAAADSTPPARLAGIAHRPNHRPPSGGR